MRTKSNITFTFCQGTKSRPDKLARPTETSKVRASFVLDGNRREGPPQQMRGHRGRKKQRWLQAERNKKLRLLVPKICHLYLNISFLELWSMVVLRQRHFICYSSSREQEDTRHALLERCINAAVSTNQTSPKSECIPDSSVRLAFAQSKKYCL